MGAGASSSSSSPQPTKKEELWKDFTKKLEDDGFGIRDIEKTELGNVLVHYGYRPVERSVLKRMFQDFAPSASPPAVGEQFRRYLQQTVPNPNPEILARIALAKPDLSLLNSGEDARALYLEYAGALGTSTRREIAADANCLVLR
uniref:Uncharacterized protein n=1 Tax=Paramoeba aestuarina TaxID=180227 RepID=A0A7S4UT70_9EUKA